MKKILPIKGYEEIYMISDNGEVFRKYKKGLRKLKPRTDRDGYFRVCLCKNSKKKNFYIHRLVAEAFIERENESQIVVNHIDENKQNNSTSNLEWCTVAYNNAYNYGQEKRARKRQKPIVAIQDEKTTYFDSITKASKILHINHANIVSCLKGERKTAGGLRFEYYNE